MNIDHGTGVYAIYFASIVLWLTALLAPPMEFIRSQYIQTGLPYMEVANPAIGINLLALGAAIRIAYLCDRCVRDQKKALEADLRNQAYRAVNCAARLEFREVLENQELLHLCAELAGHADSGRIINRVAYYQRIDDANSIAHYLPEGGGLVRGSHMVALLTDMPPIWLFDCATNRKGSQQLQQTKGSGG